MRGVRDPSATRAPPLLDGALEECENAVLFPPGQCPSIIYIYIYRGVLPVSLSLSLLLLSIIMGSRSLSPSLFSLPLYAS